MKLEITLEDLGLYNKVHNILRLLFLMTLLFEIRIASLFKPEIENVREIWINMTKYCFIMSPDYVYNHLMANKEYGEQLKKDSPSVILFHKVVFNSIMVWGNINARQPVCVIQFQLSCHNLYKVMPFSFIYLTDSA